MSSHSQWVAIFVESSKDLEKDFVANAFERMSPRRLIGFLLGLTITGVVFALFGLAITIISESYRLPIYPTLIGIVFLAVGVAVATSSSFKVRRALSLVSVTPEPVDHD